METRKHRGAKIARAGGLQKRSEHLWLVPAQSHSGKWVVDYDNEDGKPTCTCPDFAERWAFCKHIFAIEIHENRLAMPDEKPPEQKKYTQDNWPAYHAARSNERPHFLQLLHALCLGLEDPEQARGRPRTPLADRVFACALKVYDKQPCKQTEAAIRQCHADGLLSTPVSGNSVSDYMRDPELTAVLQALLMESAVPLAAVEDHFALDSSGFGTRTYGRWLDSKHGSEKKKAAGRPRKSFVKAHAACGVKTNICPVLIITPRNDSTQLVPILDAMKTRFTIRDVSGDKAYSSKKNIAAVYDVGAEPLIPFKDGHGHGKGPGPWKKAFHYFQMEPDGFAARYHKRSNAETMFHMVKGKFDRSVRSKDPVAQANEVYCKFLCHNICVLIKAMYTMGLEPKFWSPANAAEAR